MMYSDTFRVRQLNELKIQQELNTNEMLRKCLSESNEQTSRMIGTLDNFESRLTALHDLIMPVYDATNTLQIKYANLQHTVNKLDVIVEHHNSVENLSQVIKAGPGKEINGYLSQLNKLKLAIEYFNINKNQSKKKENEELWALGKLNVLREFEHLLNKFSDPNIFSFDWDGDLDGFDMSENGSGTSMREQDFKQMIYIMEWFKQTEPGYLDKLYENVIQNRSQNIIDAIRKIKDKTGSLGGYNSISVGSNMSSISHMNSTSNESSSPFYRGLGTPSTAKRNSLVPSASPNGENGEKKYTLRSRLTENLFSSSGSGDKRPPNAMLAHKRNESSPMMPALAQQPLQQQFDPESEINRCVKFVQCIRKVLAMFSIENKFIDRIMDVKNSDRLTANKIIGRIFDPVLKELKKDAERISSNVKLVTNKCTSKYIIALFSVLSDLVEIKSDFLRVLEHSALVTKTTRHIGAPIQLYLDIFVLVEKACAQSLKDVVEEIKRDPKIIPSNGNIHPITIETITFVEHLLPFDVIAGIMASVVISESQNLAHPTPTENEINLRRDASIANESVFKKAAYQLTETDNRTYRIVLCEYFYKMFKWLNLSLKAKAENYEDPYLKCIFLLNNVYKISKLFNEAHSPIANQAKIVGKCRNLNELFNLAGRTDMKTFYDGEILNYKREYSKCWTRLLLNIKDLNDTNPFNEFKLKDKDRQLLKDRFSGFNREFDEIYESQKRYYIPVEQADLAKMLREDNIVYIIGQYKRFHDTYSKMNFATNRDKYVKYSPEMLAARMREFFTAY